MGFSLTKVKDCIYQSEGKLNNNFLSHQWLCWQVVGLPDYISILFGNSKDWGKEFWLSQGVQPVQKAGPEKRGISKVRYPTRWEVLDTTILSVKFWKAECVDPEHLQTRALRPFSKLNVQEPVVGDRRSGSVKTGSEENRRLGRWRSHREFCCSVSFSLHLVRHLYGRIVFNTHSPTNSVYIS